MANYGASWQHTVAPNDTIDLNRVRVFIRVVEDGSFTAAAKRLGLPKSSVSRSLTALEKSLGVRLLQRTTRALHLTEAGRLYFQEVRPALSSLSDSAASVSAMGVEPRGLVRVSCPPYTDELIAGYVARFRKQYPLIQLDISFSARHVDLVAEGFDIALRAGALKDSSLVARRIHASDMGLFAAPSYLRRRGVPKRFSDLNDHDGIALNAPSGRMVWTLLSQEGVEESVEIACPINTDLLQFAARAAVQGLGVSLLPEMLAGDQPKLLTRVLPQYRQIGSALNIVSPSRAFEPRAVTLFKEGLANELTKITAARCAKASRRNLR